MGDQNINRAIQEIKLALLNHRNGKEPLTGQQRRDLMKLYDILVDELKRS